MEKIDLAFHASGTGHGRSPYEQVDVEAAVCCRSPECDPQEGLGVGLVRHVHRSGQCVNGISTPAVADRMASCLAEERVNQSDASPCFLVGTDNQTRGTEGGDHLRWDEKLDDGRFERLGESDHLDRTSLCG